MKKLIIVLSLFLLLSLCGSASASATLKPKTLIAICKQDGLYYQELGGKEKKLVSGETSSPKFAPDGKSIAVSKGNALWVVDTKTCKSRY